MIIDTTFFGYGTGLVIVAWLVGMILRSLLSALGMVRQV